MCGRKCQGISELRQREGRAWGETLVTHQHPEHPQDTIYLPLPGAKPLFGVPTRSPPWPSQGACPLTTGRTRAPPAPLSNITTNSLEAQLLWPIIPTRAPSRECCE